MFIDKLFAKALKRLETCLLISNRLYRKLILLVPIILDDNFKPTFFIADFNLSS